MNRLTRKLGIGVLLLVLLFVSACSTEAPGSADDTETGDNEKEDIKIGLSVSTLNNPFFVTLRDSAESKAEELGYEIVTADAQDDPSKQLSDIEDMLQQDIDVLLVNPTDSDAVVAAVELANGEEIPVVTVDRSSEGGEVIAHVASDNISGGEMAGEVSGEKRETERKEGKVEEVAGSSTSRERGEGFHNIINEINELEIVASQSADFDRTKGLSVMENIIQGSGDVDAVFAHNDEMALGALEALEAKNILEDVVVVGFDATDDAIASVEAGRLDATIAQQPDLIGESAVDAASKIANGEEIEDFIPIELKLVTE